MPTKPPVHRICSPAIPVDYAGVRCLRSSSRWQKVRAQKLRNTPLCEVCEKRGLTTAAEQVHHLVALEQNIDLAFDLENLQSVCTACHCEIEQRVRQGKGTLAIYTIGARCRCGRVATYRVTRGSDVETLCALCYQEEQCKES